MRIGVGVDLVARDEIEEAVQRFGSEYLERIFTSSELAEAAGSPSRLAECFAAKEAVLKALALPADAPVVWREVEIIQREAVLHGRTLRARPDVSASVTRSAARGQALAVALVKFGAPA